jgi:hypothetical protein
MRGLVLVALVCLSCGRKTALPQGALDAQPNVVATGGSDASEAAKRDTWLPPDAAGIGADLDAAPDLPLATDGKVGCSPLLVTWLPEPELTMCPPSEEPAACGGDDVGVVVARSSACVRAWGAVPFQCTLAPEPKPDEEIVIVEVPDCLDSVAIETALACADRIEIVYMITGACQACDGKRSTWRAFTLPRDSRPVIATSHFVMPPCPPPPPPGDTGGTTGTGGAGGAAGTRGTGGAGTAIDGGCPQTRIDTTQAAVVYAAYAGLAPSTTVIAEEEPVPGLWEEMHAQLFSVKRYADGGSPSSNECAFIYRECVLAVPTDECGWFGPIASGVAINGAFYYSWGSGSGIYRTIFGKLAPNGTTFVKTTSGGYTNGSYGPPPLVIALEAGQMLVYRPSRTPSDFNQWEGGELVGTLKDFGDRLALVDSNGQEIAPFAP